MWPYSEHCYDFFNFFYQPVYPNFQLPLQFSSTFVNYPINNWSYPQDPNLSEIEQKKQKIINQHENQPKAEEIMGNVGPQGSNDQHFTQNHEIPRKKNDSNRNMISNSLKVFRKFAFDSTIGQDSLFLSIIKAKNLIYNVSDFRRELQKKFSEFEDNYLGRKFLSSLWSGSKKDTKFAVVLRILFYHFYRQGAYPCVLTSKKINEKAQKQQLLGVRKIIFSMKNELDSFNSQQ